MTQKVPGMFAIGSPRWPGLSKVGEEAAEVCQVIMKLIATDGDVNHWDGSDLGIRLIEELGDVMAACDYAIKAMHVEALVEMRRERKRELFWKWHRGFVPEAPKEQEILVGGVWTFSSYEGVAAEERVVLLIEKNEIAFRSPRSGIIVMTKVAFRQHHTFLRNP